MKRFVTLLILVVMFAAPGRASELKMASDTLSAKEWGRLGVTLGVRVALKLTIDHTLKQVVHEWRPDRSDRHSFPSRHSTWAYGVAWGVTSHFGDRSQWLGTGAHIAANCVGFQRVMKKRHYPGDVMAGAGIGITTDLISVGIADWIFGKPRIVRPRPGLISRQNSFTVTTVASFPLKEMWGSYRLGTSLATNLRITFPATERIGWCGGVSWTSGTARWCGTSTETEPSLWIVNSIGLSGGVNLGLVHRRRWGVDADLMAGWRRYFIPGDMAPKAGNGLLVQADITGIMMIARCLAVGTEVSYSVTSSPFRHERGDLRSIGVGFLTRAFF